MKTPETDSLQEKSRLTSRAKAPVSDQSALSYIKRVGQPIAAVATAAGGPLGVIRISGNDLSKISDLFEDTIPAPGSFRLLNVLDEDKKRIDQAVVLFFKAPHSFTGEDVIEIQGHGITKIQDRILRRLQDLGVPRAMPGEFSFRSVFNQKMTLADAENLQTAFKKTGLSVKGAAQLLGGSEKVQGSLNNIFDELLRDLFSARGRVEAAIDFSEAEEEQGRDMLAASDLVVRTRESVFRLLTHYENFSASAGEPSVVILGQPNVGKSTLFNLLVGEERALVSEVAGTTRDWVESRVKTPANRTLRLFDTAGLRDLSAEILEGEPSAQNHLRLEGRGIEKSYLAADLAKIIVWVERADQGPNQEALQTKRALQERYASKQWVEIFSHADSADISSGSAFDFTKDGRQIWRYLDQEIEAALGAAEQVVSDSECINERQYELLLAARDELTWAEEALAGQRPLELAGQYLRTVEELLQRAVCRNVSQEYIGEIFKQFCLGK